jgi:catechol 2,3-dioxygenase-like lactoylglutathione lyase family enzyme
MPTPRALANNIGQIAYVVPEIHGAVRFFKEKLGVPNFLVKEDIGGDEQTYRDKPGNSRHSIAFGYAGDMQIELIQSLSGASTYSEFIEQNPKGGVHHLGVFVDDYAAAVADMIARGFEMVQSGRNGETRFAYFDVDHPIGTLLEVVYLAAPIRTAFERLKRNES